MLNSRVVAHSWDAKKDVANGVATSAGAVVGVYIAGHTAGAVCGPNYGGTDAFVAKYAAEP